MPEAKKCEDGQDFSPDRWPKGVWPWLDRHARLVLAGYWVLLAAGTHWPNLRVLDPPQDPSPLHDVLKPDKLWHVIGFGGLMVLLLLAGLGGRNRPWRGRCAIALLIAVVYSVVDELTQGLMPGRTVNASDLVTNLIVVLGVYLLAVLPDERGRDPGPPPRKLRIGLVVALPVLAVLALSPWVMARLLELKNGPLGMGPVQLHPLDWIGHGVLASIISVVVILAWPMASRRPRRAAAAALGVLLLAGPGLEVAQHFSGRSVEWEDALAHAIGVLLAMMWWAARLRPPPPESLRGHD